MKEDHVFAASGRRKFGDLPQFEALRRDAEPGRRTLRGLCLARRNGLVMRPLSAGRKGSFRKWY